MNRPRKNRRVRHPQLVALAAVVLGAAIAICAPAARAQIALSANDAKQRLDNGVPRTVPGGPADTVSVIDLGQYPPKLLAEIEAPTTVAGPPSTIAISPDGALALVASGVRLNPADPAKLVDDNRVTVIDLKANPPKVSATVVVGAQPTGVAFRPDGMLAMIANRGDGSVSVLKIDGAGVRETERIKVGNDKSAVSSIAITPDGRFALVTRQEDHLIAVLAIDGDRVSVTPREISGGLRPYALIMHPSGRFAVMANIGRGGGDADTISIIDLTRSPFRVSDTVTVGQTPEGAAFSPDGSLLAIVTMEGSNKPRESPFFNDAGKVTVFAVEPTGLRRIAQAPVGKWSQGVGFSRDNRTVIVQNMVEHNLTVLAFDGAALRDDGHRIALRGGGAALAVGR
jgi:DNA-binding beta-propeller fold protein YncE